MEQFPLVSVVIPAYNMGQYIDATLHSVMQSDYCNFEVIIVDDGSTDNTLSIVKQYAHDDGRIKVFTQPNAGACAARNRAISMAQGKYILPVDADNLITPDFISNAVKYILSDTEIKVVVPRAEFFGDRKGEWKLAPFSLHLLARKNMMDTCALYAKKDWQRVGGYCEEIIAREDWEFWISMLKDGGKVVKLPKVSLYYRVRKVSKRISDRKLKKHVIKTLNYYHSDFFERELGGPLSYARSWSRTFNRLYRFFHPRKVHWEKGYEYCEYFIKAMPRYFKQNFGEVIYNGRNELRLINYHSHDFVIKSFRKPNFINRIAYGFLRSSKAQRSCENAKRLLADGIGTPHPVGYYTQRSGLLFFSKSYYICLKSECPHTYADYVEHRLQPTDKVLRAIARTTARMHDCGYLHKDYSRGNILFKENENGEVQVEIIDLNRIRRYKYIDMEKGCKNFERLPATPDMLRTMSQEYALARGFDADVCYRIMIENRED